MDTITVHSAPTEALSPAFLSALRKMLEGAFPDDFSDEDWDHTIGGVHVWVSSRQEVISHGSVVERTLVCSGRTLRVAYVEAVATALEHRRQGHGSTVMKRLGEIIRERYVLGALSTGVCEFYEPLGWERWRGPTFVDGPRGRERTPEDDDDIMILRTLRTPSLDLDGEIVCDWRPGDVW